MKMKVCGVFKRDVLNGRPRSGTAVHAVGGSFMEYIVPRARWLGASGGALNPVPFQRLPLQSGGDYTGWSG